MDPHTSGRGLAWQHMKPVFEGLVSVDDDFAIVPALAAEFDNPTPTTYRFVLRDDARFSNGRAVTALDAQRSLERSIELDGLLARFFGEVARIEAVDDRVLEVELETPNNSFLASMAAINASILPMEEIDRGEIDPMSAMVGTGPFRVLEHRIDDRWIFERNEHSWRSPSVDRLEIRILPDDNARVAGLRNGSLHMALFDNPDAPLLLRGVSDVETVVQENSDLYHLSLQATDESSPLADVRVRRAIAYAIDRDRIRDVGLSGLGRPSSISPAIFEAVDLSALPTFTRDVARSKALLREADVDRLQFEIIHFNEVAAGRIAQVLQQDLAEAGIEVTITVLDLAIWAGRTTGDNGGAFEGSESWYVAFGDPGMVMRWWNTQQIDRTLPFTDVNPDLEAAVDAVNSDPDPARRQAHIQRAALLADDHANDIPLITRTSTIGYRRDLLEAAFPPVDGYQDILKNVADFRLT